MRSWHSWPGILILLGGGCAGSSSVSDPSGGSVPPPGSPPTYQYGAKFEPPTGRVVHGIGQWADYNTKYSAALPAAEQPAAELLFVQLGDNVRPWNPAQIAVSLQAIGQRGRIPVLDIALRGNQPTPAQLDTMADKLFGIDDEVAHGTAWDARLADLVAVFKAYRKPMLVRIGGEFSGWWNGYHPYDYPAAFRKIVAMFRAAGADNLAFVWCYEPAAPDDFDAADAQGNPKWNPGADVVDWYSIDLFAAGDVSGPTTGHGALTPFGKTLKFLNLAVAAARPVVIAESSPAFYDLSVTTQAGAAWNEWFGPYFGLIAARSEIKWFHYINYDWTQGAYWLAQGWKNNDLSVGAALLSLYSAELAKPKYLHSGERSLLKDYTKYQ